jgi:hypothetical protein
MQELRKPLGMKNYGHIAHLPGSRMGPGDHSCELGQARIATLKARDRHDHVTNVGVARVDGVLYPLVRAGYVADTSPFELKLLLQEELSGLWRWKPAMSVPNT